MHWAAVEANVKLLRREIALVQSIDKHNPVTDLADLLREHPSVVTVLELLIVHAPDKIHCSDREKTIDFKADAAKLAKKGGAAALRARAIARTFFEIGLIDFLDRVKSVEDVVKGVFMGLEPNAAEEPPSRADAKNESAPNPPIAASRSSRPGGARHFRR